MTEEEGWACFRPDRIEALVQKLELDEGENE